MKTIACVLVSVLACLALAVAGEPCPPGCEQPKPAAAKPTPPKPSPKPKPAPKPPPKGPGPRGLVGGGVSYGSIEHHIDPHIFAGVQFPKDKRGGNLQLQGGFAIEKRNAFDASCAIGCRSCSIHVDSETDKRVVLSVAYVF